MMGQGKEIGDIPELFIITVVFITSCKLFRNEYILLGGVVLIKHQKGCWQLWSYLAMRYV